VGGVKVKGGEGEGAPTEEKRVVEVGYREEGFAHAIPYRLRSSTDKFPSSFDAPVISSTISS
jgi:hypothetical protein